MSFTYIIIYLLLGVLAGYISGPASMMARISAKVMKFGLIILLLAMGANLGANPIILREIDQIGLQAFFLAASSIIFSLIFVYIFSISFKIDQLFAQVEEGIETDEDSHTMTYIIFGSVVAGILLGYFFLEPTLLGILDRVSSLALGLLLFGVGIDLGVNKEVFYEIKELSWKLLIIPVLIAIGSIIGAIVIGYLFSMGINESAAVGAGFGWYSLSGVMLAKIYSVKLGSIAFLANVFRELITVLILPLVVKYLGRASAIAPGGATAMDVTLPVIRESAGESVVIPAFVSGAILSALVPILVPLLIKI